MVGDIALDEGQSKLHAHVVLGKADATAHGGHLIKGDVPPTLQIVVMETPAHLQRRFDSECSPLETRNMAGLMHAVCHLTLPPRG